MAEILQQAIYFILDLFCTSFLFPLCCFSCFVLLGCILLILMTVVLLRRPQVLTKSIGRAIVIADKNCEPAESLLRKLALRGFSVFVAIRGEAVKYLDGETANRGRIVKVDVAHDEYVTRVQHFIEQMMSHKDIAGSLVKPQVILWSEWESQGKPHWYKTGLGKLRVSCWRVAHFVFTALQGALIFVWKLFVLLVCWMNYV
ncbi:uncharacterized protein LOC114665946 [Erpetoichthys calabaricus]|uniref:uncharacterized protein LOC114665946 n=1 Tax=Erpetoichthys calabaricus TaxID=27687 RepID=UPI00109F1B87|nr:uncharacterized protein LOC114665946 [Erpetoichthys calabaricus]